MTYYLNPPISIKTEINSENFIDNSELLVKLNQHLNTQNRYILVSRPHQFGKTFATKMICSYYSKSIQSYDEFEKLKIASATSYKQHLHKYNVIFFNADREFSSASHDVCLMIKSITDNIQLELQEAYTECSLTACSYLSMSLETVYQKTGIPFIIVIDDYDYMIRKNEVSAEDASIYLNWLTSLLKDKSYVALAYVTGILPIDNLRVSCGLNMFYEYTMVTGKELAPYFGLTEEFVKDLCLKAHADYEKIKKRYGGYTIDGNLQIFNSISVFDALEYDSLSAHWTCRNPHLHDNNLINMEMPGLKEIFQRLVEGESVDVSIDNHCYKMEDFKTVNEVLTRLIHLGYLSSKDNHKWKNTAYIPNEEIKLEFINLLNEKRDATRLVKLVHTSFELLNYITSLKSKSIERLLNDTRKINSNLMSTFIDEVSYNILEALYVAVFDFYTVQRNIKATSEYRDLVISPKNSVTKPYIIIGIMIDVSPEIALEHLEKNIYRKELNIVFGEIFLVGISYYQTSQTYKCKIEKILLSE